MIPKGFRIEFLGRRREFIALIGAAAAAWPLAARGDAGDRIPGQRIAGPVRSSTNSIACCGRRSCGPTWTKSRATRITPARLHGRGRRVRLALRALALDYLARAASQKQQQTQRLSR